MTGTPETPASLAAALAALQTRLPRVTKAEEARVTSAKGSYSYRYADLSAISAAVLPLLGQLGLSFTATPTLADEGRFVLAYELRHTCGESITGTYPLPDPSHVSPQAVGSAITYARRYALCAVTGVAPEDDDDDAAAAQAVPPRAAPPRERRRPPAPTPTADDVREAALDTGVTVDGLRTLYEQARARGLLGAEVADGDGQATTLGDLLVARGNELKEATQ